MPATQAARAGARRAAPAPTHSRAQFLLATLLPLWATTLHGGAEPRLNASIRFRDQALEAAPEPTAMLEQRFFVEPMTDRSAHPAPRHSAANRHDPKGSRFSN